MGDEVAETVMRKERVARRARASGRGLRVCFRIAVYIGLSTLEHS